MSTALFYIFKDESVLKDGTDRSTFCTLPANVCSRGYLRFASTRGTGVEDARCEHVDMFLFVFVFMFSSPPPPPPPKAWDEFARKAESLFQAEPERVCADFTASAHFHFQKYPISILRITTHMFPVFLCPASFSTGFVLWCTYLPILCALRYDSLSF